MIPLRDTIRSYNFPVVNWLLIILNSLVFLYEISLPSTRLDQLILAFGVVPARMHLNDPLLLLLNPLPLLTLFTSMFLHGGWIHILGNMWFLYIFGDNVEDRMGSARYFVFYLMSGVIAGLAQIFMSPASQAPAIGASGAIAGVLGAYLLMFPAARIITLIPIIIIPWFVEIPAIFFLGLWFIAQLISGFQSVNITQAASNLGGVAFWAHIGGFIFGALFYRLFIPHRHSAYLRQYPDEYWPW
jgi:membrane associated rhomboid family serine protease